MKPSLHFLISRAIVASLAICLTLLCSFTYSVVSQQRQLIFRPRPISDATPSDYGVPFQEINIDVKEGGILTAWWLPQQLDPYNRPTVLYCHGNAATLGDLAHVAKIFYVTGWNALLFDYRGYGRSSPATPELSEASVASDAVAAYAWLAERIQKEKIFLWGHSLGSSIAANLAKMVQPPGLIIEGGFPSILKAARARYRLLPLFDWMVQDKFATSQYISGYNGPIIFLHAERDSVVPYYLGEELFAQARSPKKFIALKGIDHQDFPDVHREYMSEITADVNSWINNDH